MLEIIKPNYYGLLLWQSCFTGGLSTEDHSLTHWGWVTHICVSKLTIIGSDNGLSPGRRQAIIWTNARILLIGPLGTNFREILFKLYAFSFKKMHLKMSPGKWWPSCLCLNVFSLGSHVISQSWVRWNRGSQRKMEENNHSQCCSCWGPSASAGSGHDLWPLLYVYGTGTCGVNSLTSVMMLWCGW